MPSRRRFLHGSASLVDTAPSYGRAEAVCGALAAEDDMRKKLFLASKVSSSGRAAGERQVEASFAALRTDTIDLMQVHNLLAWEEHLPRLQAMKAAGQLRYVGISTSEGRRHAELERILRTQAIDFVQLTYNLLDREVEQRLLPLAQERRIAVIVNRPFRQGDLLDQLRGHPLPGWAREIGCDSWAQVALKFVVSHPAVTCAIPATSQVAHLRQNMGAARGRLPDATLRARMARDVAAL